MGTIKNKIFQLFIAQILLGGCGAAGLKFNSELNPSPLQSPKNGGQNVYASFEEFQSVVQVYCLSCHGSGSPWADFSALNSEEAWLGAKTKGGVSLIKAGEPESSYLYTRTRHSSDSALANMPPENPGFTPKEGSVIRSYIAGIGKPSSGSGAGAEVSYYQDVGPILQNRCVSCHAAGEIAAALPLDNYNDAYDFRHAIASATGARRMPPFPFDDDGSCNNYKDAHYLGSSEIEKIAGWSESVARAGTPAALPPPPTKKKIENPTFRFKTPKYKAQGLINGTDDLRCFALDIRFDPNDPTSRELFERFLNGGVTGYDVLPSNALVAHHALVFAVTGRNVPAAIATKVDANGNSLVDGKKGWVCEGGTGLDRSTQSTLIAGWAPGGGANFMPTHPETGKKLGIPLIPKEIRDAVNERLPPNPSMSTIQNALQQGFRIVVQMHYNIVNAGPTDNVEDETTIEFAMDRDVTLGFMARFGNVNLQIPSKTESYTTPPTTTSATVQLGRSVSWGSTDTIKIWGVFPHAHLFARGLRVEIKNPNQAPQCIADAKRYDYNWQGGYMFRDPSNPNKAKAHVVRKNDIVNIQCRYDTRKADTNNPITFGEETGEEMCFMFFFGSAE